MGHQYSPADVAGAGGGADAGFPWGGATAPIIWKGEAWAFVEASRYLRGSALNFSRQWGLQK